MPFSYVPYAGNGSATTFSVPFPYLLKAHVKLRFGFDIVSGTFTSELVEGPGFSWISATQVQCTVAPAAGQTLTIVRETPSATRLVDWQDGSNLIANDLDTADLQNLYVVQEQRDKGDAVAAQQAAATQAANSALTASSAAVTTANSASSTANGLAASIATANANASAAVTTANSASSTANGLAASIATANANASAAVATANDASTTANGLAASIATANANASAAVSTANSAQAAANAALPLAGGTLTGNLNLPSINGGPLAGFRNAIINGNFDIWQRGTSFTAGGYGADRWINGRAGSACTMSRQAFTLGQTDVPGEPTYFCRMAVTSVAGSGNYSALGQRIEGVRTFAGQQVTVSFLAKADAAKPISVELTQSFGTGGSPSTDVTAIGVTKTTLGTSWQKVTVTATVPSISGKTIGSDSNDFLVLNIWLDAGSSWNSRTSSLGQQSGTFDIAQVQVEAGTVATPFERRPIGTELALCQRYYQTLGPDDFLTNGTSICVMPQADTGGVNENWGITEFKVSMRAAPTVSASSWEFAGHHGNTPIIASGRRYVIFRYDGGNFRAVGGRLLATNAQASAEL